MKMICIHLQQLNFNLIGFECKTIATTECRYVLAVNKPIVFRNNLAFIRINMRKNRQENMKLNVKANDTSIIIIIIKTT